MEYFLELGRVSGRMGNQQKLVEKSGYYRKSVVFERVWKIGLEIRKLIEFERCNVVSPFKSGEGKLNINFYTLQPGKSNYPYHQHFGREEVFYIISGTAILKIPKGEIEVSEGDVILYPDSGNVRVMAGGMQKSFKLESEVNYLDGE